MLRIAVLMLERVSLVMKYADTESRTRSYLRYSRPHSPHLPPPLASVLQATLSLPRHIIEMTGQQCEGGGELTEEPRDIVMQKNTTDTGPTNNDDHCLVEQE